MLILYKVLFDKKLNSGLECVEWLQLNNLNVDILKENDKHYISKQSKILEPNRYIKKVIQIDKIKKIYLVFINKPSFQYDTVSLLASI